MLRNLVVFLVRSEAAQLRRHAVSFGMIMAAAVIMAVAAAFGILAGYQALAAVIAPWAAALVVGLIAALLGLVLGLVGSARLRGRRPRDASVDEVLRGLMGRGDGDGAGDDAISPFGLVVSAALIGMILGQKLKK